MLIMRILVLLPLVSTCTTGVANETCEFTSKTGTYSSLSFSDQGGDLLGIEVAVSYAPDSYYVVFQSAQGVPEPPVVTPAEIEDGRIRFVLPEESSYRRFEGTITPCRITGDFGEQRGPTGAKRIELQKRVSYWHRQSR